MKKKKKGFTLLELIITLSITVVVLGTIFTFFLNTNKTIITSEVNSDLQIEIENIQKELSKYGSEASAIDSFVSENGTTLNPSDTRQQYSSYGLDSVGKINTKEIAFDVDGDIYKFMYNSSTKVLELVKNFEPATQLSNKVTEFKVRPLDYRSNPTGNFNNVNGLEISFVLNSKKGYSDVTTPASLIVKFRNK